MEYVAAVLAMIGGTPLIQLPMSAPAPAPSSALSHVAFPSSRRGLKGRPDSSSSAPYDLFWGLVTTIHVVRPVVVSVTAPCPTMFLSSIQKPFSVAPNRGEANLKPPSKSCTWREPNKSTCAGDCAFRNSSRAGILYDRLPNA